MTNSDDKLKELKEGQEKILSGLKSAEQQLTDKAVSTLIEAMHAQGLDELMLMQFTPKGYVPDSWNCPDDELDFEYDENDDVVYDNDEIVLKKSVYDDGELHYEMITRFGIYNNQLYYHTTTMSVTNMGDLNISETERDYWGNKWHPVNEIADQSRLRALIIMCLESDGLWRFTKKHPECCFLHKSMLIMEAPEPTVQLSDSYDYNQILPSGKDDILTFINISGPSEELDALRNQLEIEDLSFGQLKDLVIKCLFIAPELNWVWCKDKTLYGSYVDLQERMTDIFALKQEDAVEFAIYTSGIEIKHLIENLMYMYPKLKITFVMINGKKALASDLSMVKDECACVACSSKNYSFESVSKDSLMHEKKYLVSSRKFKYVYAHPYEQMSARHRLDKSN